MCVGDDRSGHHFLNWNSHFDGRDGVCGVTRLCDHGVESAVMVSGVVNGAGGAIGFQETVVSYHFIAFTFLSLFLDVVCMGVLNSVLELVVSGSL